MNISDTMCYSEGYSGLSIADYFIEQSLRSGISITNMAVLKMLYFAHGLAYPVLDRCLVRDHFYAWKWGPVEINTYNEFSKYAGNSIARPSGKTASELRNIYSKPELCGFLDPLLQLAKIDPFILSHKTHETGSPWWNTPKMRAINDNLIKEYFCNECATK